MEQVNSRSARVAESQRGVALIMVLIMLTAMTIAGIALVRVVDSANVISGNFAFRQATLNIADLGTEAAVKTLATILDPSKPLLKEAPYPDGCAATSPSHCVYFPTRSVKEKMLDGKGLPIRGGVDGVKTQLIDWTGKDEVVGLPSGYSIRYVIDRQCTVAPVVDAIADCLSDTPQGGGSKRSGATVFTPASSIYYRVSIQVTGPRNTQSHVQVILGF